MITRIVASLAVASGLLTGCSANSPTSTVPWTRPVVALQYQVADDLRSATGSETITFTPDQRICEVVLRTWPNKPTLTRTGNAMTVDHVAVDGAVLPMKVQAAGAQPDEFGTLVEVTLPACQEAGVPLTIDTGFAVTLGSETDERMGHTSAEDVAWFQTAFPLLAWQSGVGWVRDPAVDMFGETVTSESFVLDDLAVTAPRAMAVAGVGVRGATTADGARTTHHFSAPLMRDVSVMVGDFTTIDYPASGTTVHLSVPLSARLNDADAWRYQVDSSLAGLVDYLGPVPYPDLWVNIVPGAHEGIESSGSVQFGGSGGRVQAWLVTHELGHQWIYGQVGNNQALHPWMDESVVSMIQAIVDHDEETLAAAEYEEDDRTIGKPMSFFEAAEGSNETYDDTVYTAGSNVLLRARTAAGHGAFDEALRRYLDQNADRVATPKDFGEAFNDVPEVVQTLKRNGMVP